MGNRRRIKLRKLFSCPDCNSEVSKGEDGFINVAHDDSCPIIARIDPRNNTMVLALSKDAFDIVDDL